MYYLKQLLNNHLIEQLTPHFTLLISASKSRGLREALRVHVVGLWRRVKNTTGIQIMKLIVKENDEEKVVE